MPVASLDEATINSQGLGKPNPKRAREPREPKPAPVEEEPLRMPVPEEGTSVASEPTEPEPQQEEEMNTTDIYKKIFSPELREITKRVLTDSDDGKALLEEIGHEIVSTESNINQLSPWESECISQLRNSLSQYQETDLEVIVHLQVNLPIQPFSFVVKR
jgi:hypothetical protein